MSARGVLLKTFPCLQDSDYLLLISTLDLSQRAEKRSAAYFCGLLPENGGYIRKEILILLPVLSQQSEAEAK